jgi:hypothetical protein
MPENNMQGTSPSPTPPLTPKAKKPDAENYDRAHVPMEEEFDKAKWTLPPWQPVVVALAIVGVIVAILAFATRAKPPGVGSMDNVAVVQIPPGDSVLVAISVTLNNGSQKPLWIHDIKAQLKSDKGEWSDNAATAVDSERYFQAFPDLKQNALPILKPEDKIALGQRTAVRRRQGGYDYQVVPGSRVAPPAPGQIDPSVSHLVKSTCLDTSAGVGSTVH